MQKQDRKHWTFPLKPQEDEIITSWFIRLSFAHGSTPLNLLTLLNQKATPKIELDFINDNQFFKELSTKTSTNYKTAKKTSMVGISKYLGSSGNWIIPSYFNPKSANPGIQFCSDCLLENEVAHFKRNWKLSFITLCQKHKKVLQDCCPVCYFPVKLWLQNYSKIKYTNSITECSNCNFDLRNFYKKGVIDKGEEEAISFQAKVLDSLENRWIDLSQNLIVQSPLFFPVLKTLVNLFSDNYSFRLACKFFGIHTLDFSQQSRYTSFEFLNTKIRHKILLLIEHLLRDWPDTFILFCRRHFRLFNVTLTQEINGEIKHNGSLFVNMSPIPFWYWKVVYENLVFSYEIKKIFNELPAREITDLNFQTMRKAIANNITQIDDSILPLIQFYKERNLPKLVTELVWSEEDN